MGSKDEIFWFSGSFAFKPEGSVIFQLSDFGHHLCVPAGSIWRGWGSCRSRCAPGPLLLRATKLVEIHEAPARPSCAAYWERVVKRT